MGARLERLAKVEAVLLLVGALGVPTWSTAALLAPIGWTLVRWLVRPMVDLGFLLRLGLLAAFAATFLVISGFHGLQAEPGEAVKQFIIVVGLYAVGRAAGADPPMVRAWKLLALVAGFVTFAFLSVREAIFSGSYLDPEFAERAGISAFGSQTIAATGLGALSSLGMCLLPAAFARSSPGERPIVTVPWRAAAVALVVMGWYANLALQNRTPILAVLAAAFAAALLVAIDPRSRRWARVVAASVAVTLAGAAATAGTLLATIVHPALHRFQERGLGTERYEVWMDVLRFLHRYPFGGRRIDLHGLHYAHNAWLDVAYDAGLVPLLLLAAFHLSHARSLGRAVRAERSGMLRLATLGTLVSFLTTFMVEPVIQFGFVFFAASGFLLGMTTAPATPPVPEADPSFGAYASRSCAS
jgi:hypothetical protein